MMDVLAAFLTILIAYAAFAPDKVGGWAAKVTSAYAKARRDEAP